MTAQVILVPAGPEAHAVRRAMKSTVGGPQIQTIPAGPTALAKCLSDPARRRSLATQKILLVGLGGSLSDQYAIGEGILLETVLSEHPIQATATAQTNPGWRCDPGLTEWVKTCLPGISVGQGLTCDRVITRAAEKAWLCQHYTAAIVDMESAVLLQALPEARIAILRIISDDGSHDLPDIANAINSDGTLNILSLSLSFLRQPLAAIRLIQGSRRALHQLEHRLSQLFSHLQ